MLSDFVEDKNILSPVDEVVSIDWGEKIGEALKVHTERGMLRLKKQYEYHGR
jgi:hypothetical protein